MHGTLCGIQIKVPPEHELWWPVGYGGQPLYDLRVVYLPSTQSGRFSSAQVRIGFRSIRLVQARPPPSCMWLSDERGTRLDMQHGRLSQQRSGK